MNRRDFCRYLAAMGGATILSSCRYLPAADIDSATSTAFPTATSIAYPTQIPTQTMVPATSQEATMGPQPDPTATAQPTATLQPTAVPDLSQVALVRTSDRAQGVRRAIELLGINPIRGNRVLFKPNFNSADPAPASTHPDIMRTTLLALDDMGARSITVGERSGMGDTRQVLQQRGVFSMGEELGYDTIVFDELAEEDWIIRRSGDFHWADGFAVPRQLLDSECVVQTCNLKTHRFGGHFTLSLKNSVGFAAKKISPSGFNYMTELHNSPYQRHMVAEINTVYKPALIVMDGVEAFLNGGPAQGKKAQTDVVLVGTDPVAMDAVGVAMLRLFGTTAEVSNGKIFDQEQILRAVELDLGANSPEKIGLITGDAESLAFAGQVQEILMAG